MIIGSFDIQKENAVYVISNLTTCIEHPFFSRLFQSFEYFANTSTVSSYSLCAKSIVSLDKFIESTQFNITSANIFGLSSKKQSITLHAISEVIDIL